VRAIAHFFCFGFFFSFRMLVPLAIHVTPSRDDRILDDQRSISTVGRSKRARC